MVRWLVSLPALLVVCAATSASAQAADPAQGGTFKVYGYGTKSCGTWLADRQNTLVHNVELSWVIGWVSASNAYTGIFMEGRRLRHTDPYAIEAWVDKYCRENPLQDISDASMNLVGELLKPE